MANAQLFGFRHEDARWNSVEQMTNLPVNGFTELFLVGTSGRSINTIDEGMEWQDTPKRQEYISIKLNKNNILGQ